MIDAYVEVLSGLGFKKRSEDADGAHHVHLVGPHGNPLTVIDTGQGLLFYSVFALKAEVTGESNDFFVTLNNINLSTYVAKYYYDHGQPAVRALAFYPPIPPGPEFYSFFDLWAKDNINPLRNHGEVLSKFLC